MTFLLFSIIALVVMFNCCHLPSDPLIIIGRQTELAEVASERENIVKKLCRSLAFFGFINNQTFLMIRFSVKKYVVTDRFRE